MNRNDIENYLIVSRKAGTIYNYVENKTNVLFLNKRNFFDFFSLFKLIRFIMSYKPTHIHAHQTSIYWVFMTKILLSKPIVIWHDHWGNSDLLKDSDRKLIKFLSFLIDGVICVNDRIKDWNSRNLKVNNKNIIYIPNFPLIKRIKKNTNEVPVFLCLANFRAQKDHFNLIEACNLLKKDHIKFKLLIAGTLTDSAYVEKVKQRILDYKLNQNIDLLGCIDNVSELLSQADVGVLSSISEGLPVALLEYGLSGLPVVCTDVGQCGEVLGKGDFGWVVPPQDPNKLFEAMKMSILNQKLAQEKGRNLAKNIELNFGSGSFFKKYLAFLEQF